MLSEPTATVHHWSAILLSQLHSESSNLEEATKEASQTLYGEQSVPE
jgi:hypothetical protein